ncbi:MAG: hypothetical protein H7101_03925 [Deinococcales bacterium]|nr:hypothetical protein [Chitinophagaceae bacterium]
MKNFGLVDEIVPEPIGGAHWDYTEAASLLKTVIISTLAELKKIDSETRINNRIEKFGTMGFWEEIEDTELVGDE